MGSFWRQPIPICRTEVQSSSRISALQWCAVLLQEVGYTQLDSHRHKYLLPKVMLFLCLIKYHAMNTYGGMEAELHALLNSALDRHEW